MPTPPRRLHSPRASDSVTLRGSERCPWAQRLVILCRVLPRPVQAALAEALRDAVVIVVGGRGIGKDGDEAGLRGMGAARRRDVSIDQDPTVVVTMAGVVEILVKLIAVHLPQELSLA